MRNILLFLSISPVVFSFSWLCFLGRPDDFSQKKTVESRAEEVLGDNTEDLRRFSKVFLHNQGSVKIATLQSYEAPIWMDDLELLDWQTGMVVNDRSLSKFRFEGWLSTTYPVDLEGDGGDELVVEILSGKTINTIIYKFVAGVLTRVPVSIEKPGLWGFYGIASRNSPEFRDLDGDGRLEMLAYYRFFPPEMRRKVEVYKFNGRIFDLVRKYEEKMPEVYL